jgi:CheY-like chemotaxis protein
MQDSTSIVVVDDDHDVREALGEALTEEGFDTRLFESAHAALDFLRARAHGQIPTSLILLDLMMPGMNGWQFREEQLKDERLREIPVVVITASRLGSEAIRAREVLFKPVALGDLVDAVHRNASKS